MFQHKSIKELPALLAKDNTILLDVRKAEKYASGHIETAVNFPLDQLADFQGDTSKEYLIICQAGINSQLASELLDQKGYRVTNIQEGMNGWTGPIRIG